MKIHRVLLFILMAIYLTGCFPSTVSVGPDGRIAFPTGEGIFLVNLNDEKATCLYEAEKNKKASWVQWSPRGRKILYAVKNEIFLTSPEGRDARSIYTSPGNMGYFLWSPDEKWISITEVETKITSAEDVESKIKAAGEASSPDNKTPGGDEKAPDNSNRQEDKTGLEKESLPQLTLIDQATGKVKYTIQNIAFVHRWMPDSKAIIVFHISSKNKDSGNYIGEISKLMPDSGTLTPLVNVESTESWVDVSPSGEYLFFTARNAWTGEKKKEEENEWTQKLFSFSLKTEKGKLTSISKPASFVSVSPDSEHLLVLRDGEEGQELVIMDPDGEKEQVLTRGVASESSEMGGGKILPAWLNNNEVIFWKYVTVLSPGGKSLITYRAKVKGMSTEKIHTLLEKCINQSLKQKK